MRRLLENTSSYRYNNVQLPSCMTLDTEHFHSLVHYKEASVTAKEYSIAFGSVLNEMLKTNGSFHYYTSPRSWYPIGH